MLGSRASLWIEFLKGENACMAYDDATLSRVFDRTNGKCHLCRKMLVFSNYGRSGHRGAWHVEHSRPRAKGGADHGNNRYAACVGCNLEKGTLTTRTVRMWNGHRRAPLSRERYRRAKLWWTIGGGAAGLILGGPWGLVGRAIGTGVGTLVGSLVDPDAED